ncbi:MAG: zinc-binding dehydrogenase [Candidatus Bathyarchaeia archaeon]
MKAAVLKAYGRIEIEDVELPQIRPNEILVNVKACGLCPSDIRVFEGLHTWRSIPTILGHEFSGVVAEVGEEVEGFKKGDRVVAELDTRDCTCRFCIRGKENLCINRKNIGEGALAEYTKALAIRTQKFSSNTDFEEAAFTEPLACCVLGNLAARMNRGDDVAIIGAGQIGLMHLQLAKLSGARVIVSDLKEERLELALKLGADEAINASKSDPVEKVKELTGGKGVEASIVAIGHPSAIEQGIKMLDKCGTVVLFGGVWPKQEIKIDPNLIHYNEINITGSFDRTRDSFAKAIKLIDLGLVKTKPLISHRLSLEEAQKGFELVRNGNSVKVMIFP